MSVLEDHGHDLVEAEPDHDRELLSEVFMTLFAAHNGAHAIDTGSKMMKRTPHQIISRKTIYTCWNLAEKCLLTNC